jgi:hypothetical protein
VQVSALQSQAQTGTMFQVASNFNCLEFGSVNCDVESGSYCTHLMIDSTQGPAAASGCGLAAITQAHAAFFDRSSPPDTWGQTKERLLYYCYFAALESLRSSGKLSCWEVPSCSRIFLW